MKLSLSEFVCFLTSWAGNYSITESLPELIQQVRQDFAGAPGGKLLWQSGWKRLAPKIACPLTPPRLQQYLLKEVAMP